MRYAAAFGPLDFLVQRLKHNFTPHTNSFVLRQRVDCRDWAHTQWRVRPAIDATAQLLGSIQFRKDAVAEGVHWLQFRFFDEGIDTLRCRSTARRVGTKKQELEEKVRS